MDMNETDVLSLILKQINDLRVPVREDELLGQIKVIRNNVAELRKAFMKAIEEKEMRESAEEEPTEEVEADVRC